MMERSKLKYVAMRDLRLRTKLISGFLLTAFLMLGVSVTAMGMAGQIAAQSDQIVNTEVPKLNRLTTMQGAFLRAQIDFRDAVITLDEKTVPILLEQVHGDTQQLDDAFTAYLALPHQADELPGILAYRQAIRPWLNTLHALTPAAVHANAEETLRLTLEIEGQWQPQISAVSAAIGGLIATNTFHTRQARAEAMATNSRTTWTLGCAAAIAFLLALALGIGLTQSIAPPLEMMVNTAQRVAHGDLRPLNRLHQRFAGRDEVGRLTLALTEMIDSLRVLIGKVTKTATQVDQTATQIDTFAQKMGDTAAQVTENIEDVARRNTQEVLILRQAASSVLTMADQSTTAFEQATKLGQVMDAIKRQVNETAERVTTLDKQSAQIGQIAAAINEIADQTNLLALNAAIEAARAGEHGRGFSVVADQVRQLAERSAAATREITGIVRTTQTATADTVAAMRVGIEEVDHGLVSVRATAMTSRLLRERAEEVRIALQETAASSDETRQSANAVAHAMTGMLTQVTATIATAGAITDLATELRATIEIFSLAEDDTGAFPSSRHTSPLAQSKAA